MFIMIGALCAILVGGLVVVLGQPREYETEMYQHSFENDY